MMTDYVDVFGECVVKDHQEEGKCIIYFKTRLRLNFFGGGWISSKIEK
jgi:hypothetical protein